MKLPMLNLPRLVPVQQERTPQETIPQTLAEREQIRDLIRDYVGAVEPVPPLSFEELRNHAQALIDAQETLEAKYLDYVGVLINNEVWREQLATVPYERRLLLLPKCLRVEDKCPAPFDEFGLLCKSCGLCTIQDLQEEAERLGYPVLVAEGSAIVMALIQTGKIDAIVGVSCLSVLERAFPYMETAAIPGVAIPLLQDDCKDTTVDLDWVWDVIHLSSDDKTRRLDLDALRQEVDGWFAPAALAEILGASSGDETEAIARRWLSGDGKRWRPFLVACVYKALQEDPEAPLPADLARVAVAVECFHKASLVHDDIEDEDATRYGVETLHVSHGIPVALNVGDLLIGEGYRLLAESEAPSDIKAKMFAIAAQGHRTLCLGQGAELCWARDPRPLVAREVLEIFRKKTAPAFEVALQIGAVYGGASEQSQEVLEKYSEALGIAYQIRDDLEDLAPEHAPDDMTALRPSLLLALSYERARGEVKAFLESAWRRQPEAAGKGVEIRTIISELGSEDRARNLLDSYKEEAVRSLARLDQASLKGLLRRVIGKIFSLEVKGWCSEFEARNAPGGATLSESAR